MTSIPASRRARAITLAPRSWPSSPGLATRTRILGSGIATKHTTDAMTVPRPETPDAPLRIHAQLPEEERIHVGILFDLLGHGLALPMAGLSFDPQKDRLFFTRAVLGFRLHE